MARYETEIEDMKNLDIFMLMSSIKMQNKIATETLYQHQVISNCVLFLQNPEHVGKTSLEIYCFKCCIP